MRPQSPQPFQWILLAPHEVSIGDQVKVNGQLGQLSVLHLPDLGDILAHLLSFRICIVVADYCASVLTFYDHLPYFDCRHSF